MRTEMISSVRFFCLLSCAALAVMACAGCDVEKIASVVERHEPKLSGQNAAAGGVSYLRPRLGSEGDWSRTFTSCRLNAGPADISFGRGSEDSILTIKKDGEHATVVLRGPDGTVSFDQTQCSIRNLELSPHAPNSQEMDGTAAISCENAEGTLKGGAQFQRCSR